MPDLGWARKEVLKSKTFAADLCHQLILEEPLHQIFGSLEHHEGLCTMAGQMNYGGSTTSVCVQVSIYIEWHYFSTEECSGMLSRTQEV